MVRASQSLLRAEVWVDEYAKQTQDFDPEISCLCPMWNQKGMLTYFNLSVWGYLMHSSMQHKVKYVTYVQM